MGTPLTVLHVQTRAYPTNHRTIPGDAGSVVTLSDQSRLMIAGGSLTSLIYGDQPTREADLSESFKENAARIGWASLVGSGDEALLDWEPQIDWVRLRILGSAAVLLTTAVRYERSLAELGLHEVCDLDARINDRLRQRDRSLLATIFESLFSSGELVDPRPTLEWWRRDRGDLLATSSAARYNCHFLTTDAIWEPDDRSSVQPGVGGSSCKVLLPYTYEWSLDPDLAAEETTSRLEPLDLAVAQRSVLGAAAEESVRMLEELALDRPAQVSLDDLRRHLDRVRTSYHRLDSYRYDSAQSSRGLFLAARKEMGLDEIHQRTEAIVSQAADSLHSAATARTNALDGRLNRLAAVFTVAASGGFILQALEFASGGSFSGKVRSLAVGLVLVLSTTVLAWTFRPRDRSTGPNPR